MVLVCHSHQFIFLKSYKSAGTSVEMCLEPYCRGTNRRAVEKTHSYVGPRGIVGRRLINPKNLTPQDQKWFNHMSAEKVCAWLGPKIWRRYTKVSTIRNPFDRAVSYYYYVIGLGSFPEPATWKDTLTGFQEFLAWEYFNDDRQIVFVGDQYVVDRLIRYEHLSGDLKQFAADLEIDLRHTALPQTKLTRHRRRAAVPEYFDTKSADMFRSTCAWMFEKGSYPDHPIDVSDITAVTLDTPLSESCGTNE